MEAVFHKSFGKGQLVSDDNTNVVINFESIGEKKILKKFLSLITEDQYNALQSAPKAAPIKQPIRHDLRLMSSSLLVDVLKAEEDKMQRNYYFDLSEVVNSEIYTDGVDYYNRHKQLIGNSWKLAMHFAKTR